MWSNPSEKRSFIPNGITVWRQTLWRSSLGKPLGTCIKQRILDPLGMQRTTLGYPKDENTARAYVVSNDGTSHKVPFPNVSDDTGFSDGAGAKTIIKDLLLMYQSPLFAYGHQSQSTSGTTRASPFKYLQAIFPLHIEVGSSDINDVAYCLSLYRIRLPGNPGVGSMNSPLIGPFRMSSIDAGSQGLDVYPHTANISCLTASAFLISSLESAVVVMTMLLPLMDPIEFVGQSNLYLLLGEQVPADERAFAAFVGSYQL
ncbi:hypothetical protein N7G274_005828 [Stereocaulon virgatum]|uniref:Beta-lactamase-related domain-containing protein n=1 Tax=Stereocaulon virgatum TaxID=373712 RepID=A0ABR4A966_9LECA